MVRHRLFLTLFLFTLTLGLVATAELAKPALAITNNSHTITTAPTGDHYVYESSYQNPGFYANGLYWVFYEDSSPLCEHQAGCLYYVTSSDGTSWSSATQVSVPGNAGIHVTDSDWSVANSGNQIFYARYNESAFDSDCNRALLFGSGTMSGASITWQPEQVVRSPTATATFPSEVIGVDSNNQVWIGYLQDNHVSCGGNGHEAPHIIHKNNAALPPAPLSSGFIVSNPDPVVLQSINFNATATSGKPGYSYSWIFGDGSTGTGQNVTHAYLGVGTFTVVLETTDSSSPSQTVNSTQAIPVGVIPSGNQPPGLTVPSSMSVRAGASVSFTLSASDADGESVTVTANPLSNSFSNSTRQFNWTPTENQANQTWDITFNATDSGGLSVTRQVLINVSLLWTGDISLPATTASEGIFANWHVDIAPLSGGGVYAAYWADKYYLLGRLYDGSVWGPEEQISLTTDSTDVNSFVFSSGTTVYAIWYNTNAEALMSGSRSPSGSWGQYNIGPGESPSVLGLPGNICTPSPCHRYSLPFSASFDQSDSRFYVFWYNQTNRAIDEWSGFPGSSWRLTPNAFATLSAIEESTIGSFHYSALANGKNSFGIVWMDGATAPYRLNFGLETVGPIPTFQTDTSWNPKVACIPIQVSIEQILGGQDNASSGGATESGSIFNPGILAKSPGDAKRWLTPSSFTNTLTGWQSGGPPCIITNADGQVVSAFVEVRGVQRGPLLNEDFSANFDSVNGAGPYPNPKGYNDTTFNIFTPGYAVCTAQNTTGCMHTIHLEFDHDWKAAGYCGPNTVCDPYQLAQQTASDKTLIDFQGFIYWDPDHVREAGHAFSGWEIHPVTAWRISCLNGQFCNPSYSLSASPSVVQVDPGQKVNSTITINTFSLFSGPVPLSAVVTPSGPTDPTVAFTPNPVIVPPCNQCAIANSTMTITALSSSTGTYIVTITGTNGTTMRTTTVTVQVQGFSLSANPSALTIPAGGSVNSTITLTSLGSFSGSVTLGATTSGCACGFVTTFNPVSVNLNPGGKANTTLTVSVGHVTGSGQLIITGTSGTVSSSVIVPVNVVDFSINANPISSTVLANRLANSTITIAAINGFTGTVTLAKTVPTGLTCSLSLTTISITSTQQSGASTLQCSGSAGNYIVNVTANSTGLIHTATFGIAIQDYSISATPSATMVDVGAAGTSTIRVSSVNGFTGTISFNQNGGTPCGLNAPSVVLTSTATSATVTLTCTYQSAVTNNVQVASTSGPLAHGTSITFQIVDFTISAGTTSQTVDAGAAGTSTITLTALNGYNRTLTLTVSPVAGITCLESPSKITLQPTPVTSILSCSSTTAADYALTVTGANGTLSHPTAGILFHVIDFALTTNIPTLTLGIGQNSQAAVAHVASLNGFTGTLSITIVITPSGPSASATFSSLKIPLSGNQTSLNINAGQIAGLYTLNITATRGSLSHWTIITLNVTPTSPILSTSLSSNSPIVGTSVTDSATLSGATNTASGSVIYYLFFNGGCIAPATSSFAVVVTNGAIPSTRPITFNATAPYSFNATYFGDNNNKPAVSPCEPLSVQQAAPGITTTLSSNSVQVGQTVTDSAALSTFFQAGGTVNYNLFTGSSVCTGTPTTVSTVPVTNGIVPNSRAVLFNSTNPNGYSFQAVYSGDANNKPATSNCEPITINPTGVTLSTNLSSTSITVGGSASDSSSLTGETSNAGGTVTYNYFSNPNCLGSGTSLSLVAVSDGVIPPSRQVALNSTGMFSFNAVYSGDANNKGTTSGCEPVTVTKTTTAVITNISPSATVTVGSSVTDHATLSGGFPASGVTGTVTYTLFSFVSLPSATSPCSGGSLVGTAQTVNVGTGNSVPPSASLSPPSAGFYGFSAVYNGDGNNTAATSNCEPLTVNKQTPTLSTTINPSSSIVVGTSVSDQASITGGFPSSGILGTVTYRFFNNGICTGTATTSQTVTIGSANSVAPSNSQTPTTTGQYSFNATYSGDNNNGPASSPCEPLTVQQDNSVIATLLSANSIQVGQSVSDSATLSSTFQAGGTVTYNLFIGSSACIGTGSVISSVPVTNGVAPISRSVSFNSTNPNGYSFQAAYTGDVNNKPATSACEPLTVGPKGGVTITATLSSSTIIVGGTVNDAATLTGTTTTASGTVTYYDFFNGNCGATQSVVSIVTVTNVVVPNSRSVMFNSTGSYSFEALYSGDADNAGASSSCQTLLVNKAAPSIATSLSPLSITVGGSVTDSSTMTGGYGPAGTVSYEYFPSSTCSGPAIAVGTPVTVINGVVPNSSPQAFNSAGSYGWNAIYSGDTNNNATTSPCEPLTVNKTTPSLSTNLSSTTPVVGTTATDTATLTNSLNAGGSVTYYIFANNGCTAPATTVSIVNVSNNLVPNSRSLTFNSTGGYSFQAVYAGDANNSPATSGCEPLTVKNASPFIATSLGQNSIVVGNTASDSASLTGGYQPSGTVQYNLFANNACTGPSSVVSTVTIAGGVVPNSRAVVFNGTGTFGLNAIYAGDKNNNPITSSCELLTVIKASPTITTALSANSVTVGQSASDSATMSAFYQATGTLTYNLFVGSNNCGGTGVIISSVTVANGSIPSSRGVSFNSTNSGGYSWNASYSGDSNNNIASSTCEPFTVNPTSGVGVTTVLSSNAIVVGNSDFDSATLSGTTSTAGGTVTYSVFTTGTCSGTGSFVSNVSVTNAVVPSSRPVTFNATGVYGFEAAYSGDSNNLGAASACELLNVQKISPGLTTSLATSTIIVGNSVTDSSALTGSYKATGTVTYEFFAGGLCGGAATVVGPPVTVTNGIIPNSVTQSFNSAGLYSWNALYSGDSNNSVATSACESLSVNKTNPTLTTNPSISTPVVGKTSQDSATLTSSFNAGGTITYNLFGSNVCNTGSAVSTVVVTNGVAPSSRAVTFNATGPYSFEASYSGDSNNNGATSPCEPLTVQNASPIITTTLGSASIIVGQSTTAAAVISNGFQPTGTIQYQLFQNGACNAPFTVVSIVAVTSGIAPASRSVTFNSTGSYGFQAVYSGDGNNNGITSICEPLSVGKTNPAIATTLSSSIITVGTTISDSSLLSGAFQAIGTVTYNLFTDGTCSGTATVISSATVANNLVPNSRSVQINATGSWSFDAAYSGDSNNNGNTGSCEPFSVNKTSPTIVTSLSSPSIIVGGSVFDTSTMSGTFQAGGTVTYSYFTGSTCAGTATAVGTGVPVTNGVVPNSASQSFTSAGPYGFQAVYSGDANNDPKASSCEPLSVTPVQNIGVVTSVSSTSPIVGTSVFDSVALTGTTSTAGGTVTYTLFTNGACTSPGAIVSIVAVTNGAAPPSRSVTFNSTGSFSFDAAYSGDTNNAPAISPCEPLTVAKTAPTIATTLSSSSIIVGNSAGDSANLGSSYKATGSVTYEFFSGNACVGSPTAVGTPVTVSNGNIPGSLSQLFNTAGLYSWNAIYTGDANNSGAISTCEPLTVNKISGDTITTTLSSANPIVGTSATDSATLANTFQAGGTVTYTVFANSGCSGQGTIVSTVDLVTSLVPDSRSVIFNATGFYSFNAAYTGDTNNNPTTSSCETLNVQKASPTIATSLASVSIVVGNSDMDSATIAGGYSVTGTVTYQYFTGGVCGGPATSAGPVAISGGIIPSSLPVSFNVVGPYSWNAIYSGDGNNNVALSSCEPLAVNKTNPTITTGLSNSNPIVGTAVTDSATITSGFNAGGSVGYNYFTGGVCSGAGILFSTQLVTNGNVPPSSQQIFASAGSYSFNAIYSGDSNNNQVISSCEPLTVQKTSPTISTNLTPSAIIIGQTAIDSATLSGGFGASGTVTYSVFANPTCTSPGAIASTVQVTVGSIPNSRSVVFNATGTFGFQAFYSGDANNNFANSLCELLAIQKATPSISTTLSSTAIQVGQTAKDSSGLTGAYQAVGTVTYSLFGNDLCNGAISQVSVVTVTNGLVPDSRLVVFNSTGSYSFQAAYSGDSNNAGVASGCEPLSVVPVGPVITTSLSQNPIVVGSSVFDSATLQGTTKQATGTVTYTDYSNGNCANGGAIVSVVAVISGSVSAPSRAVTFNNTGTFSFNAQYSGDPNNNPAPSPCEPLNVNKASPSITTALTSSTLTVGGSTGDTSSLAGSFTAGGTVTYEFFTGSSCSGPATSVGAPVSINNGIVPPSSPHTFDTSGSYSWDAIYSGDSNNNPNTSPCEQLIVSKTNPVLATTLPSSAVVGTSVSDSATLTGGFTASGSVSYSLFTNGICTTPSSVVSVVTVFLGTVPNSRAIVFNSTGSYSFQAVYTGDSNNNGSPSPCESLIVAKATPSISTTISPATIIIGSSATDQASITGGFDPTGAVTYTAYSDPLCTTSAFVSIRPLGSSSAPFAPTTAGTYYFVAGYSGDSNNSVISTFCGTSGETLNVNKLTPSITTSAFSQITVGNSATLSSTLTGGYPSSGVLGSVTYTKFVGAGCSGTGTTITTVNVGSNNNVPTAIDSPSSVGPFSYLASYSGDANNNPANGTCANLTVNKATPTVTTSVSPPTITVGSSASDLATISGGFSLTGTITYSGYSDGACTTLVFTSAGVALGSPSTAFTPASAGAYFFTATYSGDANNNVVTTACGTSGETLTVNKATPTVTSSVSPPSINIGSSATDLATLSGFSATGTVTYTVYSDTACATLVFTSRNVPLGSQSGPFTPATAGTYFFKVAYSGDPNNNEVTTACGATGETLTVNKVTPIVSTTVSPSSIPLGGSATDLAAVSGGFSPTGTVTYTAYSDTGCTTLVFTSGNVSLGTSSGAFTPTAAGTYFFKVAYNGDTNNNAVATVCGASGETLGVGKTVPTVTSTVSPAAVTIGSSATDLATITGSSPTGTVTYTAYSDAACTTLVFTSASVPLGTPSVAFTATAPGTYRFIAAYTGDGNNTPASSTCNAAGETLIVNKATPTVTTAVSPASIVIGNSATDLASFTAGFSPTGTVTYTAYSDSACTVLVFTSASVPKGTASAAFNPTITGTYFFKAAYIGDPNNNAVTTACGATGETVTVTKVTPTVTTALTPSTVTIGGSASDIATVSGGFSASGTVTYTAYSDASCTILVFTSSNVALGSPSAIFTPAAVGPYFFNAAYSGDANNNAVTTVCGATGETLTVNAASPSISSSLSATIITLTHQITDSATLANFYQAGGTVSYNQYSGSNCAGTGTTISTVTVTNGIIPNSAPATPTPAGQYSFNAVYNGDSNNNGATSSCEVLTVTAKSVPVISTTVKDTTGAATSSTIVGVSVHDTTGITPPIGVTIPITGAVTYTLFSFTALPSSTSPCSGGTIVGSSQTVTIGSNNIVPDAAPATPLPAGIYAYAATYSGDPNYASVTSNCEPLTVSKASVVLTLSADSPINVGSSTTILATLKGGFPSVGVSGTITYNRFVSSNCAGTATAIATVQVGAQDSVPTASDSPPHSGLFSYSAFYGGDSNNNQTSSGCQTLTTLPLLSVPSGPFTITAGNSISFIVNATDPSQSVELTAGSLPNGASFGTVQPYADHTVSSIFRWTPPSDFPAGEYNVTFTAMVNGVSMSSHVAIHVIAPAPAKTAPLPLLSYSIFGVVGFLAVLGVALLLRRLQNPRRKSATSD